MACNDCYLLDSIPECTENLEVGYIDPNTEVYIYVKNIFTGYVHREEVTSDGDGLINLDLTQPETFYNQDSIYEIWVTLRTDNERIDITVSYGEVHDCLSLAFFAVNDTTEE
jgi:hypothetical protein